MDEVDDYIEKAKNKLKSSETLYEIGQYGDSVSISYYVMFLIAKALLILKDLDQINIVALFIFLEKNM